METVTRSKYQFLAFCNTPQKPAGTRKPGARWSHMKCLPYTNPARDMLRDDPEFFAHTATWIALKGKVRDVRITLAALSTMSREDYVRENGQALLCTMNPRQMEQGLRYAQVCHHGSGASAAVTRYLAHLETQPARWERLAVHFRQSLRALYFLTHYKGQATYTDILFQKQYPPDSVFAFIAQAPQMDLEPVLRGIQEFAVPTLVAGPLIARHRTLGLEGHLAYLERLTPAQVVKKTRQLQKLGLLDHPATRALYQEKLEKAGRSTSHLGTTERAIAVLDADDDMGSALLAAKLRGVQEQQMDAARAEVPPYDMLWLGDISDSMQKAIGFVQTLSSLKARLNTGEVHAIFFNQDPRYMQFTGLSYEEIVARTSRIQASGMTSIGVGLKYARQQGLVCDVIGVVTDGQENTAPLFRQEYQAYCDFVGCEVPVYVFGVRDYHAGWIQGIAHEFADVNGMDPRPGHGLEGVVSQIRPQTYSLVDEVYATPLLTLEEVLR